MKVGFLAPGVVLAALLMGQACGEGIGAVCSENPDCPSSTSCVNFNVGDESRCLLECETEDDCAPGELCSAPDPSHPDVCHPPHPVCDPEDSQEDCRCGFLSDALRVEGEGEDCTVTAREVSVCAWYRDTCYDGGCTTEYFRYSYPDDAGYIISRSGPGQMPEGWERDGTPADGSSPAPSPTSCPAAEF